MDVLSDPMNLPSSFWDYMVKRWLRDAPVFPISQVFGFTQFTVQPVAVVDTTAAGDTFNGALASVLASGDSLIGAVQTAVRAASLACSRLGAQPSIPTLDEVSDWKA